MHYFISSIFPFLLLLLPPQTAHARLPQPSLPPPRMTAIISVPFGGGSDDHNIQWMQRGGYWSEVEHHYERVSQQQVEMIVAAGFAPVLVLQASKGTRERQAQDHGVPPPGKKHIQKIGSNKYILLTPLPPSRCAHHRQR